MSKAVPNERRKARRRPVLESFSVAVVLPRLGFYKLKVHDVSESGLRFDAQIEGEAETLVTIKAGETVDVQLYLNQSLFLPLQVTAVRVEDSDVIRRIGAGFADTESKEYKAYLAFLNLIDSIVEAGHLDVSVSLTHLR